MCVESCLVCELIIIGHIVTTIFDKATTNCIVVSRPGYGYNSVRAGARGFLLFIMDVVKGIRATKYYKNMVNTCQYTYKPQRAAQQSNHHDPLKNFN